MAITPKTAAAGVVGIGGTAAAGYGVSTLVKGEEWTISKQLEKDGYIVLDLNGDSDKWTSLATAGVETSSTASNEEVAQKKKEFQNRCKKLLVTEYLQNKREEYEEALKKCTELQELKELSKRSGFVLLTEKFKETVKSKWTDTSNNAVVNEFKGTEEAPSFSNDSSLSEDLKKAIDYCNAYSNKFNRFSSGLDNKLANYQKLCASSLSEISKKTEANNSNWKHMKNAGFEVLKMDSTQDKEWLKIFGENYKETTGINNEEEKLNLIKIECDTLRNKTLNPLSNTDATYKDAVKKCTKLISLKKRARSWGLIPLNTKTLEDNNSDRSAWEKKKNENKNDLDTAADTNAKTWKTLLAKCKEEEVKNHFTTNFENNWDKYLKGCMKEGIPSSTPNHDTLITYKYWTKQAS